MLLPICFALQATPGAELSRSGRSGSPGGSRHSSSYGGGPAGTYICQGGDALIPFPISQQPQVLRKRMLAVGRQAIHRTFHWRLRGN